MNFKGSYIWRRQRKFDWKAVVAPSCVWKLENELDKWAGRKSERATPQILKSELFASKLGKKQIIIKKSLFPKNLNEKTVLNLKTWSRIK